MINAAIVGVGRWGQRLVDSVSIPASPHIRFTRAVARNVEPIRGFAERNGLGMTTRFDEILADRDVHAVVLATPHSQHGKQIVLAAEAGKHVFVEKPLTLDVASAVAAVNACRKAAVVLGVGHNRRFLQALGDMKRAVSSGALGEILHLEGAFSGNFGLAYQPGIWRAMQAESPAGGMTAMGIHIIDAFIHLAGDVASVRCESQRKVLAVDVDDTTSASVRFKSGATGYLSTLTATGRIVRVQVFGTCGWVHLLDHHILEACNIEGKVTRTEYPKADIEREELEAFAKAAMGRSTYPVPLDEVIHGIAVMQSCFESATADGARVDVPAP
jgi:predicted dehydrogenase